MYYIRYAKYKKCLLRGKRYIKKVVNWGWWEMGLWRTLKTNCFAKHLSKSQAFLLYRDNKSTELSPKFSKNESLALQGKVLHLCQHASGNSSLKHFVLFQEYIQFSNKKSNELCLVFFLNVHKVNNIDAWL